MISESSISALSVFCRSCEKGSYNISGGQVHWENRRAAKILKVVCTPCPFGGICEGNIKSKGGYWGYNTKPLNRLPNIAYYGNITFLPCPVYYCCASKKECVTYNTCKENRYGILCSKCQNGFSCTFNSKYDCVDNNDCYSPYVSFLLYGIIIIVYTLILLYLKEILLFVKRIFKSEAEVDFDEDCNLDNDQVTERVLPESFFRGNYRQPETYQLLLTINCNSRNYLKTSSIISGSIKILFFFYQAAAIIRVHSVDKKNYALPRILDFLSSFFNVRLDLTYSNLALCVLPNLDIIHVEAIKLGIVFSVIILLGILGISSVIYQLLKKQTRDRSNNYDQIDDKVPSYSTVPFIVRVKCTYVQFLLIGFSSIASFSFNALNCVDINSHLYLYKQASIQCYQTIFIALWVAPFCIALQFASTLLTTCSINPRDFLVILTCPPYLIWFLIKIKLLGHSTEMQTEDAMLAKHLLMVINEPFKESKDSGSKLCWEAVLIFRRILLVVVSTFIMSAIQRLYPVTFLLIVFLIHHIQTKPYSDNILNIMDMISLNLLISLAFVNMFWAFTREYDLTKSASYQTLGKALIIYEMFILSLPILLLCLCLLAYTVKIFLKCYKFFLSKQD